MVGSILNYGDEIIGNNDGQDLELVHCRCLRKMLCVQKSTNLDGLYGETGRYPMKIHRRILMFKYWLKILTLKIHHWSNHYIMYLKQMLIITFHIKSQIGLFKLKLY